MPNTYVWLPFSLGVMTVQCLEFLPSLVVSILLSFLFLMAACFFYQRWLGILVLFFLGISWSIYRSDQRLSNIWAEHFVGEVITVEGIVRGIPNHKNTYFEVERLVQPRMDVSGMFIISSFEKKIWKTGSRWRLDLKIKSRHGLSNRSGFDQSKWLWSHNIQARAIVKKHSALFLDDVYDARSWLDRIRVAVIERIQEKIIDRDASGLLSALTVGAQSELSKDRWRDLQHTGTNHLVSISGLHITLVAGLALFLVQKMYVFSRNTKIIGVWFGLFVAFLYALLAGFSVPTQRALWMWLALCIVWTTGRSVGAWTTWSFALALVLFMDPFAIHTPGFWLSFGLVGSLLWSAWGEVSKKEHTTFQKAWKSQWVASIASWGPLLYFFQSYPVISPIVNIWAIPFISIILVPLTLLAVLVPLDFLLSLAALVAKFFWVILGWFSKFPLFEVSQAPLTWYFVAIFGTLILLLSWQKKWVLWSCFLIILPVFYKPLLPSHGDVRIHIFDVGQGLSVLIQTRYHQMLYDTGALPFDMVLKPNLRSMGISSLDQLMVSHHDKDHDGAAPELLSRIKVQKVLAGDPISLQDKHHNVSLCEAGQTWQWDGVDFYVLSPQNKDINQRTHHKKNNKNNGSCVLMVTTNTKKILIPGDIDEKLEEELVGLYGDVLQADMLILGHHGSKTSSSAVWLDTVKPNIAITSAGFLNQFNHPHPSVLDRLQSRAIRHHRTDHQGSISFFLNKHHAQIIHNNDRRTFFWEKDYPRNL
jgi:competence protein ComEC